MTLKFMKVVVSSVLATLLVGCGNKYDAPKVSSDAEAAVLLGNVHKSKLAPAFEKAGLTFEALLKTSGNKLDENGLKECIVNAGLDKSEVKWTVISIGDVKNAMRAEPAEGKLPSLAVAVACDHDLNKTVLAYQDYLKKKGVSDFELRQTTIADTPAWEIRSRDLVFNGRPPCIASLGGKLLLVASSSSVLEKQIALYRDGKGEGKPFADFKLAPNELAKFRSPIHDTVGRDLPELIDGNPELGKMFNKIEKFKLTLFRQIEMFDLALAAISDTDCRLTASVEMGSEADAKNFRAVSLVELMEATDQLEKEAKKEEAIKGLYEAFKKIEIKGEGKVVEVVLTFPVSEVLKVVTNAKANSGASAKTNSGASSMAMKGRNLFVGIIQANTEREAVGLASAWPRTAGGDISNGEEDIAEMAFSNATDYFSVLFDMANYGTEKWSPYVICDLGALSGPGYASGFTGTKLKPVNIGWSVAANVKDEMADAIPVLVSCNFDPSQLLSSWDGMTDGKKLLKTTDGGPLVIVRKGGAAQVLKPEMCTYEAIYNRQEFTAPGLKYLTPKGMVSPTGK